MHAGMVKHQYRCETFEKEVHGCKFGQYRGEFNPCSAACFQHKITVIGLEKGLIVIKIIFMLLNNNCNIFVSSLHLLATPTTFN